MIENESVECVESGADHFCIRWAAMDNGVPYRLGLRFERGTSTFRMGEAFRDFGEKLIEWSQAHPANAGIERPMKPQKEGSNE